MYALLQMHSLERSASEAKLVNRAYTFTVRLLEYRLTVFLPCADTVIYPAVFLQAWLFLIS